MTTWPSSAPRIRPGRGGLFLEEAMVTGMDEVVNLGLDVDHPERVPVEVEIVKNWGGG
jgi:hypothetical protein